jgi:hypothetical protein
VAEDSVGDNLVKALLGVGAGFGLFYLATYFGFGGGGHGSGSSSAPRALDAKRLSFVMTPAGFQQRTDTGLDPQIYSTDDLIARVRDGGRADVELRASGAVLEGQWQQARDRIKHSGIVVFEPAPPTVSGFSRGRGYYGHGRRTW